MSHIPGAALVADKITKSFPREPRGDHVVIGQLDLEAKPGSLVLVEGATGSGRTTLLRCLFGTYRIDSGAVVIESELGSLDLTSASDRAVAWFRERYVSFFDGQLLAPPHLPSWRVVARSAGLDEPVVIEQLQRFGLDEYRNVARGRLRPAQARAFALAAALSRSTSFYLLDDPLLGQEEGVIEEVLAAIGAVLAREATVIATASAGGPLNSLATRIHRLERNDEP